MTPPPVAEPVSYPPELTWSRNAILAHIDTHIAELDREVPPAFTSMYRDHLAFLRKIRTLILETP